MHLYSIRRRETRRWPAGPLAGSSLNMGRTSNRVANSSSFSFARRISDWTGQGQLARLFCRALLVPLVSHEWPAGPRSGSGSEAAVVSTSKRIFQRISSPQKTALEQLVSGWNVHAEAFRSTTATVVGCRGIILLLLTGTTATRKCSICFLHNCVYADITLLPGHYMRRY